jgi:dTDP-glucose 4,6-dehydratase
MTASTGARIVAEDIGRVLAADLPWERLSGATIAVTGATGFIGGYLVRTLLALHAAGKVAAPVRVIGIARDLQKANARFADLADAPLHWIGSDLRDPRDLSFRADWILHAASPATPKVYGSDPLGTLAPNVIGTWRLLQLADEAKASGLLFVSTSEVYGAAGERAVLAEDDYGRLDPTSVRSAYAESKRLGETMCVSWMHQKGLPVYIVRPFHTYGPGVDLQDGRVFADFVADVVARRPIRLASDGQARRAFCYISDAVGGIFHVLLRGEPGRAYNIANPEGELSVGELADLLAGMFPERGIRVERAVKAAAPGYLRSPHARLLPSIERAAALGWQPAVRPAEGFRRMVESYV